MPTLPLRPGASVGLHANADKPAARAAASRLGADLARRGIPTFVWQDGAPDVIATAALLVVFGGDGTLLAVARKAAPLGVPLLPVHLGRFGFVTEVSVDALLPAVEAALSGACVVQERMILEATLKRAANTDVVDERLLAVNDIVVAGRAVRMVHVRATIGDEPVATYAADGVIVASPTGSTGYSLSAGGPLVHPAVSALIVTPIAPHTLSARTLLVPDTEVVCLTVEGETRHAVAVTADGQDEVGLSIGDTVQVRRAPCTLRLVTVGGPSFYQKVRSRWHLGERAARGESGSGHAP